MMYQLPLIILDHLPATFASGGRTRQDKRKLKDIRQVSWVRYFRRKVFIFCILIDNPTVIYSEPNVGVVNLSNT